MVSRSSSNGTRIAIVGAGIGGLCAANTLCHEGFDVHVFEQAPELTEVGAGFNLTPNGLRVLEHVGVAEEIARLGGYAGRESEYLRADRTLIGRITTTDSDGRYMATGMHRADMVDILARALPAGVVHTGHRCVSFEQDAAVARVAFEDGMTFDADVVVGADGIHSVLAKYVDDPSEPVYSGRVAYRGLVAHSEVPEWPDDTARLWMGGGKHFLVFPVRAGRLINYVGFVSTEERLTESWSTRGDVRVLEREFSEWDPVIARLIGKIDTVFGWGLYDRLPLQRWSNGRLTLLGDAAHPMLPHVGQGANQSIEDAAALARLLVAVPDHPAKALQAYEAFRRERTSEVQRRSRTTGRQYDSCYDDLADRDAEIVAASQGFRLWLYDYDVLSEVEPVAAALRG